MTAGGRSTGTSSRPRKWRRFAVWLIAIGGLQLAGFGYIVVSTLAEKPSATSSLRGIVAVLGGCFIAAAGALAISWAAAVLQEERHVGR